MKILLIKKHNLALLLPICLGLFVWWLFADLNIGSINLPIIDPGILQIILIALCTWLLLLKISDWLTDLLMPLITAKVHTFFGPLEKLTSWQQHVLYLALFALLVLSGIGCLIAIC
jgi:hypothetical protein